MPTEEQKERKKKEPCELDLVAKLKIETVKKKLKELSIDMPNFGIDQKLLEKLKNLGIEDLDDFNIQKLISELQEVSTAALKEMGRQLTTSSAGELKKIDLGDYFSWVKKSENEKKKKKRETLVGRLIDFYNTIKNAIDWLARCQANLESSFTQLEQAIDPLSTLILSNLDEADRARKQLGVGPELVKKLEPTQKSAEEAGREISNKLAK